MAEVVEPSGGLVLDSKTSHPPAVAKRKMAAKRRLESGETVTLRLTAFERETLARPEIFFCGSDLREEVEREREMEDGLNFTLDQYDRFAGCIAAHANHTEERGLRKTLEDIYDKVCAIERKYEQDWRS